MRWEVIGNAKKYFVLLPTHFSPSSPREFCWSFYNACFGHFVYFAALKNRNISVLFSVKRSILLKLDSVTQICTFSLPLSYFLAKSNRKIVQNKDWYLNLLTILVWTRVLLFWSLFFILQQFDVQMDTVVKFVFNWMNDVYI